METNLVELIEKFQSEDKCREYMEALRWPDGPCCPRCQSQSISQVTERNQYDCNDCRYQFSVTSGSVFHDTHLPLWKWFLAVYMVCESKKSISANQLKRTIGVSYKTAWYLCHRIRTAMQDDEPLNGVIEADEAFIGGKSHGKRGRGASGKTIVAGMVERGGRVKLEAIKKMDQATLHKFIEGHIGKSVDMVVTDCNPGYKRTGSVAKHRQVNHSVGYVDGDLHINAIENVWSLLKRSIIGAHHHVSAKHLPAYLTEVAFRFNNRNNENLFRDTMLKLLQGDHVTFEALTAEAAA